VRLLLKLLADLRLPSLRALNRRYRRWVKGIRQSSCQHDDVIDAVSWTGTRRLCLGCKKILLFTPWEV
jgi:hypothetical protein